MRPISLGIHTKTYRIIDDTNYQAARRARCDIFVVCQLLLWYFKAISARTWIVIDSFIGVPHHVLDFNLIIVCPHCWYNEEIESSIERRYPSPLVRTWKWRNKKLRKITHPLFGNNLRDKYCNSCATSVVCIGKMYLQSVLPKISYFYVCSPECTMRRQNGRLGRLIGSTWLQLLCGNNSFKFNSRPGHVLEFHISYADECSSPSSFIMGREHGFSRSAPR